jgi:hypothetical protein
VTYDESAGTATIYINGSENVGSFQLTIDKTFKLHIMFERQATIGSHHPYAQQFGRKYIPQYSTTEMLIKEIDLQSKSVTHTSIYVYTLHNMYACCAGAHNVTYSGTIPVAAVCDVIYEMVSKLDLQVEYREIVL